MTCSKGAGPRDQTGNRTPFNCSLLRKLSAVSRGYQSARETNDVHELPRISSDSKSHFLSRPWKHAHKHTSEGRKDEGGGGGGVAQHAAQWGHCSSTDSSEQTVGLSPGRCGHSQPTASDHPIAASRWYRGEPKKYLLKWGESCKQTGKGERMGERNWHSHQPGWILHT